MAVITKVLLYQRWLISDAVTAEFHDQSSLIVDNVTA